jgi:hypothetical protein
VSTWNGPFTFKTLETPVGCGIKTPSNNFQNGSGCRAPSIIANDIRVPQGNDMSISKIIPTVMIVTGDTALSVDVIFYDDNAGLPGTVISTQTGIVPTSTNILGVAFTDFSVTELELDLTPVVLPGNASAEVTYWISISVTLSNMANNCFWETTTASVNGAGQAFNNGTDGFLQAGLNDQLEGVYDFQASCSLLGIDDEILSTSVSIYPTAVENQFTIKNESNIALTTVVVYDINGRQLIKKDLNNLIGITTVNASGLSQGLYFVELYSNDGKVVKKIIKK